MTYEVRRAILILEERYGVRVEERRGGGFTYTRTLPRGAVVITTCNEEGLILLARSAEAAIWAETLLRQQEGAQQ